MEEKNTRIEILKNLRKVTTEARWTMIDVESKYRQLYSSTSTSNNKIRKSIDEAQIALANVENDLNELLSKLGEKNTWS